MNALRTRALFACFANFRIVRAFHPSFLLRNVPKIGPFSSLSAQDDDDDRGELSNEASVLGTLDASALLEQLKAGGLVLDDLEIDDGEDEEDEDDLTERAWLDSEICQNSSPLTTWTRSGLDSTISGAVRRQGVARVNGALSEVSATELRAFVLRELARVQESQAEGETLSAVLSPSDLCLPDAEAVTTRWDLRLPLTPPVMRALDELLGGASEFSVALSELAGGPEAEIWEVAALVSKAGAAPQTIHSDTVFDPSPCLFTSFVALQPVTQELGPTRFLVGTHDPASHRALERDRSGYLASCAGQEGKILDALLGLGDASLYDGRLLHGGTENSAVVDCPDGDSHYRALFYVTLRHAAQDAADEVANEAAHSILPQYRGKLRLGHFNKVFEWPWSRDTGDGGRGSTSMSTGDGGGKGFGKGGGGKGGGGKGGGDDGKGNGPGFNAAALFLVPDAYDWSKSTEENYALDPGACEEGRRAFWGPLAALRASLDLDYHTLGYCPSRQALQDAIVSHLLSCQHEAPCDKPAKRLGEPPSDTSLEAEASGPWVVLTAGAMGAGKSHCIRWLRDQGFFPLPNAVQVDQDMIRYMLPEMEGYLKRSPAKAGALTQKEAGYIAELLTLEAFRQRRDILIDGSMRQSNVFRGLIGRLRGECPDVRVALIHVVAPPEQVKERALKRAKTSGRIVPTEVLLRAIEEVPNSVGALAPLVDAALTCDTSGDEPRILLGQDILTGPACVKSWSEFADLLNGKLKVNILEK